SARSMTARFPPSRAICHVCPVPINALVRTVFSFAVARRGIGTAADGFNVAALADVVGERRSRHHVLPAIGAADLVVDADRQDVARARLVAGIGRQRHLADQDDRDESGHGAPIVTRRRPNRNARSGAWSSTRTGPALGEAECRRYGRFTAPCPPTRETGATTNFR